MTVKISVYDIDNAAAMAAILRDCIERILHGVAAGTLVDGQGVMVGYFEAVRQ